MVKTELLENAINVSGLKTSFIVDTLGISRQAFNAKKNNKYPFRTAEVFTLCTLLRIDDETKNTIFFAQ